MKRLALLATAVVALNLVVASAHGLSHSQAHVPLQAWQLALVQLTVYAVSILAAVLYRTPRRRLGAVLAGTMLASLLFGLYFHFVADTSDHVSLRANSAAGVLFVVTALFLVPAESLGFWFGVWSC